eukprot:PhF_6_TR27205/c0_g1_i2/m.40004
MKDEQMRKDVKVQAMIRIVQRVSRGMHDRIVIGAKWGIIRDEQIAKDRESMRRIIMYQRILRGYNARRSVAVLRAARQVQRFGRGVFARRLVCALKVQKLRAAKLLRNVFAGLKERMQVRNLSQQALLGLSLLMNVVSSNEVTPLSCCGLNQLGSSCFPAHSPEDGHSSKLPRKLHVLSDNLSISHDHKILMDIDRHEKYSVHVYHDGQAARNEAQAITLLGCGGAAISHHSIIIYRPIQPSHRTLGEIASHLTLETLLRAFRDITEEFVLAHHHGIAHTALTADSIIIQQHTAVATIGNWCYAAHGDCVPVGQAPQRLPLECIPPELLDPDRILYDPMPADVWLLGNVFLVLIQGRELDDNIRDKLETLLVWMIEDEPTRRPTITQVKSFLDFGERSYCEQAVSNTPASSSEAIVIPKASDTLNKLVEGIPQSLHPGDCFAGLELLEQSITSSRRCSALQEIFDSSHILRTLNEDNNNNAVMTNEDERDFIAPTDVVLHHRELPLDPEVAAVVSVQRLLKRIVKGYRSRRWLWWRYNGPIRPLASRLGTRVQIASRGQQLAPLIEPRAASPAVPKLQNFTHTIVDHALFLRTQGMTNRGGDKSAPGGVVTHHSTGPKILSPVRAPPSTRRSQMNSPQQHPQQVLPSPIPRSGPLLEPGVEIKYYLVFQDWYDQSSASTFITSPGRSMSAANIPANVLPSITLNQRAVQCAQAGNQHGALRQLRSAIREEEAAGTWTIQGQPSAAPTTLLNLAAVLHSVGNDVEACAASRKALAVLFEEVVIDLDCIRRNVPNRRPNTIMSRGRMKENIVKGYHNLIVSQLAVPEEAKLAQKSCFIGVLLGKTLLGKDAPLVEQLIYLQTCVNEKYGER